MSESAAPSPRRKTVAVKVGHVTVGGGAPVVVQSMTNTDTADADATAGQVADLDRGAREVVRLRIQLQDVHGRRAVQAGLWLTGR